MMTGETLFAYGTLQDPQVQYALLGKRLRCEKAFITDWGLHMGSDGYLFIKPLIGATVHGQILYLNQADFVVLDRWEGPDVYRRERYRAFLDEGTAVETWMYTRRNHEGLLFFGPEYHGRTPSALQEDIGEFLKGLGQK